ncbi:MAG TPA: DUF6256 family protein [Actinomycetota bacterium]|nr:DUF6256 family protein [Actinomycetota bacterium]
MGDAPKGLGEIVADAVVPLVLVYGWFLALLVAYGRHLEREAARGPRPPRPAAPPPARRPLLHHPVPTFFGGYTLFVSVVALYSPLVAARTPGILEDAITGGALLAFGVAAPGMVALSLLRAGLARLARAVRAGLVPLAQAVRSRARPRG